MMGVRIAVPGMTLLGSVIGLTTKNDCGRVISPVSKVGHSLRQYFLHSVGVCYHRQISYRWPATDDVDLQREMIWEARRAKVVKGSSEVMPAEELCEGLEKVMQRG
jgi:hypothetical protein